MGSCMANAIQRMEDALEVPNSDEVVDTNGYFADGDDDNDVDDGDDNNDLGSDVLYSREAASRGDVSDSYSTILGMPGAETGTCHLTASGRRSNKLVDDPEAGIAKAD